MNYTLSQIAKIAQGTLYGEDKAIEHVVIDSRTSGISDHTLFIALDGGRRHGHHYINEVVEAGGSAFMVESLPEGWEELGSFLVVDDTLVALQEWGKYHREKFKGEVIAITGSNGKTTVKEWVAQLWNPKHGKLTRSPRSYNSQIGVPLSLLMIEGDEAVVIIEAGVSQPGEMDKLEAIISPTTVVVTNIGDAHSENFKDSDHKLSEKLLLAQWVAPHRVIRGDLQSPTSAHEHNRWCVSQIFEILELPMPQEQELLPLALRLEVVEGVLGSTIINDSYSLDPLSLRVALDFAVRQGCGKPLALIITDMEQVEHSAHHSVTEILRDYPIEKLITIGKKSRALGASAHYCSTELLLENLNPAEFAGMVVLIKGARSFRTERLSPRLEERTHTTVLEVNLAKITENLRHYRELCAPSVEIMAMVKANAYGLGATAVSRVLVESGVSSLAVAFADEGVALRRGGITAPILVLNSDEGCFSTMIENRLEPEIFSIESLKKYNLEVRKAGIMQSKIHLKIDSGMHRLGFCAHEIEELCTELQAMPNIRVDTIFTHLSSADDPREDEFTRSQITLFERLSKQITDKIGYTPRLSIANSAGTERFAEAHCDIVRLGIGLYENAVTLSTKISQIKDIQAGESIGYNRREIASSAMTIAVLPIGYADGLKRALSCRKAYVSIGGQRCEIVGAISMDITTVDITHIKDTVQQGQRVTILGQEAMSEREMAQALETIPYEVLTSISPRIKRLYTW